ncbi:hypothetical protein CERZMDRAFT_84389 [Cercospora zeae-maydis SCOH1-5]|uniref:Uncharacterized protein n=1 Tax=Cercospora zeae-maydis SCOH1-5 TaxID=717836 RepID=A0A6A6FH13_9PEZI|nr:hypothetical protein CERZMDRAFT_84389 [Cercospora zeae-maydis SCOH1-5]
MIMTTQKYEENLEFQENKYDSATTLAIPNWSQLYLRRRDHTRHLQRISETDHQTTEEEEEEEEEEEGKEEEEKEKHLTTMAETAILSPSEDRHHNPRSHSSTATPNALEILFSPFDLLPNPQKTYTIRPSTSDIKEVHCHTTGLQPYTIKRKALRPGRRPMITIASLPNREIVAGTKAGRRECHIFVGSPEQGATVWLPVVQNRSSGFWTFNANERVLRWIGKREREAWLGTCGASSNSSGKSGEAFELVDVITGEPLAGYRTPESSGATLEIYGEMEQSLELLTMASILAVLERGGTTRTRGKTGEGKSFFLGSECSSPESSRSASPCPSRASD